MPNAVIAHLRQAWKYLTQAEKNLQRARAATESDLRESFILLAIHLIELAKSELKAAVKLK